MVFLWNHLMSYFLKPQEKRIVIILKKSEKIKEKEERTEYEKIPQRKLLRRKYQTIKGSFM